MVDDTNLLESEFALVFSAGSSERILCTSIPIVNDTLLEGPQEFTVTVTDVGPHALINTSSSVTTITIVDNERKINLTFISHYINTFSNSWEHWSPGNPCCI